MSRYSEDANMYCVKAADMSLTCRRSRKAVISAKARLQPSGFKFDFRAGIGLSSRESIRRRSCHCHHIDPVDSDILAIHHSPLHSLPFTDRPAPYSHQNVILSHYSDPFRHRPPSTNRQCAQSSWSAQTHGHGFPSCHSICRRSNYESERIGCGFGGR